MQTLLSIAAVLILLGGSSAETTEGYQKVIRPIAEGCKESTKASDGDVEAIVHLTKDFTPEGKCLSACVMEKVGLMSGGQLKSVEEMLVPYRAFFADDSHRLARAQDIVSSCRAEALKVSPQEECAVAHSAVMCTILKT